MRNLTKLWRPCDGNNLPVMRLEPMSQPNSDSFSDHLQTFCERVYREIKRKLYSGRREDPEVLIEIQVDDDVFNESLGRITSKDIRGINSYMKFFLMKLLIVISAQSGMSGSRMKTVILPMLYQEL